MNGYRTWTKGFTASFSVSHCSFHDENFHFSPVFSFPFLPLNFASFGGRWMQGWGLVAKGQENEWDQSA